MSTPGAVTACPTVLARTLELDTSTIGEIAKAREVSRMGSIDGVRLGAPAEADRADGSSLGKTLLGAPIGMLLLDQPYNPALSGTPGTVSSSEVAVRGRIVEGCTVERLVFAGDDRLEEPVVAAARKLV